MKDNKVTAYSVSKISYSTSNHLILAVLLQSLLSEVKNLRKMTRGA